MEPASLISMPIRKAEKLLEKEGIKYTVKELKTFKLGSSDTEAVVKIGCKDGALVLYVCKFRCAAGNDNA